MRLRLWNSIAGVLHAVQAIAMWILIERTGSELFLTRLEFDPQTSSLSPSIDFLGIEVAVGVLLVSFLAISAIAHLLISTVFWERYRHYLSEGTNPYRWYEYSISASLMMVAIAILSGIRDPGTLSAVFGLIALMNLMGLEMERRNDVTGDETLEWRDWRPYLYGVFAGAIPWIIVWLPLLRARMEYGSDFPDFVLWASLVTFLLFNVFALNMWLQYKKWGPWSDYLWGEKIYIVLSLVAKSALAWWVYVGAEGAPTVTV